VRDGVGAVAVTPRTESELEEVVVSAQKRVESLQSTPIAIAVISGDDLRVRGIDNLAGFATGAVPSLRWSTFGGRSSAFIFGMRGMVPSDATQVSRDNATGIYVDGVYVGRVQGLGADMLDLQRVEVLRGPQGTLFGRNSLGGAVQLVTKDPTGELGGRLSVGARNFNGLNASGVLDLPEVAGVSVKLSGAWAKRDGWIDNPEPGQRDWAAYDRWGGRLTALWRPSDSFSARYSYDRSRDRTTPSYIHIDSLLQNAAIAPFFSVEPNRVTRARGGFTLGWSTGEVDAHAATLEWSPRERLTVRSITGYREMRQTQMENFAGTFFAYAPNGLFARLSLADAAQHQFSEELQVVGSTDRLRYTAGAIYYEEHGRDSAYTPRSARYNATGTGYVNLATPIGSPPPARASVAQTRSTGAYAQATWTPSGSSERLHVTAGLRYTDDQKDGRLTLRNGVPLTGIAFDFRESRVDPKATVAFDWTPDLNTYLSWGTGYRSGGANSRSPRFLAFGSEEASTWELGLKSEFWQRRARVNVAAWATRFTDMQIEFVSPLDPSIFETANALTPANFKGLEVEATLQPTPDLTFTGSYTYTDAKIPAQISPFDGRSIVTVNIANTPKHAAALAVTWDAAQVGSALLQLNADASFASRMYAIGASPTKTPGYALLNARVTLTDLPLFGSAASSTISLWGKNLTNEAYITGDFEPFSGPGLANVMIAYYNEPRTYGLDLTVRF
jgi:iron complex outermembrane receptor protein